MKRVLFVAMAALILLAPAANAQSVNEAAVRAKLEKSNADIANPKKNVKAATWLNRSKVYFESLQAPTKNLFMDLLDQAMLPTNMGGEPKSKTAECWEYPWVKVYFNGTKVKAWEQTRFIDEKAGDVAIEALVKAYELDAKLAPKVKEQLDEIINFYVQMAECSNRIKRYDLQQVAYEMVIKAEAHPVYGAPDYATYYLAGQLAAYLGASSSSAFPRGEELLTKAIENGYFDEKGDIYYYLFHCCYGQKEADKSKLLKSKEVLLQGIDKFPKNERILNSLMQLYTVEEGMGNPEDLVALIEKALENDPKNADLWFGRGRVYYKLNNYDECINSFHKVVEIKPDDFDGNYYLAVFYMAKGNELYKEAAKVDYKSQKELDEAMRVAYEPYRQAVPWFEKAYELNNNHLDTVDCLKSICFRLRDEEGYMEKYNKYNPVYRKLKGLE